MAKWVGEQVRGHAYTFLSTSVWGPGSICMYLLRVHVYGVHMHVPVSNASSAPAAMRDELRAAREAVGDAGVFEGMAGGGGGEGGGG